MQDKADIGAHLALIQSVVARVENNSFASKALAITLAGTLLAFGSAIKTSAGVLMAVGGLSVALFWFLDARYLALGRQYRSLFDAVRRGDTVEPFSLDASRFRTGRCTVRHAILSWSVAPIYLVMMMALLIAFFVIPGT